jgi:hypothetical protein
MPLLGTRTEMFGLVGRLFVYGRLVVMGCPDFVRAVHLVLCGGGVLVAARLVLAGQAGVTDISGAPCDQQKV